ncbi:DUF3795 domain-containing protein [Bacteroidota bacterium]
MDEILIAPCGMNCGVCLAHLRNDRKCPGCHGEDINKSTSAKSCIIRNCEKVKISQSGFCFECLEYPCKRLKQLDKRYRTKYAMSMIENLEFINGSGLSAFLESENERWRYLCSSGLLLSLWGKTELVNNYT